MNLDNLDFIHKHDPQNMLGEINILPTQLEKAWELGKTFPLDGLKSSRHSSRVVICGMGGSAIGADLLAAYVAPTCPLPVFIHRDYGLPAWVNGPETLVIASSHSGNTEETLDSFYTAVANKCQVVAITTGGKLANVAGEKNIPLWKFDHEGQPRAAVGYSFGLLLAVFSRLGFFDHPEHELSKTVETMRSQQKALQVEVDAPHNPAKRLAGQLMGRWVNVFGSGCLAPVSRRWKTQINEIAKAGAGFETLPEANHNALAGLQNPADTLSRTKTIFLRAASDNSRNLLRIGLTQNRFMVEGMDTDIFEAQGESSLEQMWTTLHFGDYMAFYLAMAYGTDPTPVESLETLKAAMREKK